MIPSDSLPIPGGRRVLWAAAGMMFAATVLNACDGVIVRLLAGEVHPFVIAFFRAAFGLGFLLPWILRRGDLLASPYRGMHILRAALKLASLLALFVAFANAPLSDVTAISFTAPLFLMLGACLFLGEGLSVVRVASVVTGFAGMLIILRPGAAGYDVALLFALVGAVLTATIQLILKGMSGRDRPDRLVAWNLIAMVPLALILALSVWQTPSPRALALMAVQGALGAASQALVTRALSMADASFLAPLDFLRLPVIAVMAFIFFGEVSGPATWIGAGAIVLAVLLGAFSKGGKKQGSQRL
ncbi:DMT family transporter [Paracoccus sp. MBLB3053]|uniref:DMT family transporter n=1 Tax=Paracoccus aurantius TaxID=3073814 RepID=A0ABU2HXK1_9RHOB|nr:DMT family transporter [Paracoccus sp. MBLB3053]MDS9469771.1 DMT family transporter [Paracoccus sp. MBLB3053]